MTGAQAAYQAEGPERTTGIERQNGIPSLLYRNTEPGEKVSVPAIVEFWVDPPPTVGRMPGMARELEDQYPAAVYHPPRNRRRSGWPPPESSALHPSQIRYVTRFLTSNESVTSSAIDVFSEPRRSGTGATN
jgi:hypothetical protein